MTSDCSPYGYAAGQALLDRLKLETDADDLAIDLAVALGILIAEQCPNEDLRLPHALANAIALAASSMRRKALLVSGCVGSA